MTVSDIQERLRRLSTPAAAAGAARFFKTGPGQYGEGDIFLGLRAKEMHQMSKEHSALPFGELRTLLKSPVHEDRMLALLILVRRAEKGDAGVKERIYKLYLGHTRYVNNWDLVDASAREIVGTTDQHRRDPFFYPPGRVCRHDGHLIAASKRHGRSDSQGCRLDASRGWQEGSARS
jgi:3-methyladenine DNA glycosylase AlkD